VTIEHCPTEQMWTNINTKPKQGQVYRVFRGHVMGIPADYKDSDYAGKVPLSPDMSMLPMTKAQLASQECVGENQLSPTTDRPRVDVIGPRVDVISTDRTRVDVISTDRPRVDVIGPRVDVILTDRPRVDVIGGGAHQLGPDQGGAHQLGRGILTDHNQASDHQKVSLTGVRPSDERAPIKLVDGRPWSPGVYRALRLLGRSLETAWEKAFIRSSHF
jgi:hypothetical protein